MAAPVWLEDESSSESELKSSTGGGGVSGKSKVQERNV